MARHLVHGLVLAQLLLAGWGFGGEPNVLAESDRAAVQGLREEINLLNLINGLQLSREQTVQILGCAREAEAARNEAEQKAAVQVKATQAAFTELREAVARNQGIPKEVEARAQRAEHELKDLREKAEVRIRALEEQVLGGLGSGQLMVLSNYKNCLIPTPDLKDPTRVGQAASGDQVVRQMQGLRKMPEAAWASRKDEIFAQAFERIEKGLGKRTPKEAEEYRTKFFATVEEARQMSDVEFETQKDRLGEALKPRDKVKDFASFMESLALDQGKPGKAARILFAPSAVKVLEQRVALLTTPSNTQRTDLGAIQPAPSCQDGQCALEGRGNLKPGQKP